MQPEEPKEVDEPKPEATEPHELKAVSKPKQDQDVHRLFWERTRFSRTVEALTVQSFLWISLFAFGRGMLTGPGVIIPTVIAIGMVTYLLISMARIGSIIDIAAWLFYSFSTVTADFSNLYWNYGTANNFTERLTHLDAIYFTIGTLTTAGTGNISATSEMTRGLQTLQMVLDIGLAVFAVSLVLAEISSRIQRRPDR